MLPFHCTPLAAFKRDGKLYFLSLAYMCISPPVVYVGSRFPLISLLIYLFISSRFFFALWKNVRKQKRGGCSACISFLFILLDYTRFEGCCSFCCDCFTNR
uniref:Uncharacterized protein n=1 Tax=Trypanosoma congolense (strain IL3000) TaxID=1068625 RepID=G0V0C9_TRYCI|nr:hypothetical protein, unlikely [Trypanosoma congolense IL3000]